MLADLVDKELPKEASLGDVLNAVWANEVVTSQCPNLVIRLTTLRGEVSRRIWQKRGNNPEEIQLLAVGTVAPPVHLPRYHNFINNFYNNTTQFLQQKLLEQRSGDSDEVFKS